MGMTGTMSTTVNNVSKQYFPKGKKRNRGGVDL